MQVLVFVFIALLTGRGCFARFSTFEESFQILEVEVEEGGRAVISEENIKCKMEDASSISFSVAEHPQNGNLIIDKDISEYFFNESSKLHFTMQDVMMEKVLYYHNGNEEEKDFIKLEFVLNSNPFEFQLFIRVKAINDPPVLRTVDRIQISSQLKLTLDILTSFDADDNLENLVYTFYIENFPRSDSVWIGKKLVNGNIGSRLHTFDALKRVDRFTHGDLLNGKVFLVHSGPSLQTIKFKVSDGKSSSLEKVVVIEAHHVVIHKLINGELWAVRGIGNKITKRVLNFMAESDQKNLDVVYQLTEAPKQGVIQIFTAEGRWENTDHWKQENVIEGKVQYVHFQKTSSSISSTDSFKFVVSCLDEELPEETFTIKLIEPQAIAERNTGIDVIVDRECFISDKHLLYSFVGPFTNESIFYKLMATPFYGDLKYLPSGNDSEETAIIIPRKNTVPRTLGFESNFTQLDLNERRVIYRLRELPPHAIVDNFQFAVFVPGFQSGIQKFQINYFPEYPPKDDPKAKSYYRLINNGLFGVFEGLSKIVSIKDLCVVPFSKESDSSDFLFKITREPKHGWITRNNEIVWSFTLSDINKRIISYSHDDSENDFDFFNFSVEVVDVRMIKNIEDWVTESTGTFEIYIILRNDNAPKLVTQKDIVVPQGKFHALTNDDISFTDADTHYNISHLEFEARNLSNVFFFYCCNSSEIIKRFIQKKIEDKKVCLQHHGLMVGENILKVSDGLFSVEIVIKVIAEPIYLRVKGSDRTKVSQFQMNVEGKSWILLERKYFAVESNLLTDNDTNKVHFFLLNHPIGGDVRLENGTAWHFTMNDVESKDLKFHISNKSINSFFFRFVVKVENYYAVGSLNILMHSNELHILQRKIATIDLSRRRKLKIDSDLLMITHSLAGPEEINIIVISKPTYGHLYMNDQRKIVTSFRQSDINEGKISYVADFETNDQQSSHGPLPLNDSITFEASCTSSVLRNIFLKIEFMPQVIGLTSAKLSVQEGGNKTLNKHFFLFEERFFTALDIFVIEEPLYGKLISTFPNNPDKSSAENEFSWNVTRFSTYQVDNERISYVHDGSEERYDCFMVIAKSTDSERMSEFLRVDVDVISVNDNPLLVVGVNVLNAEKGSMSPITENHLSIRDLDTYDDEIVWRVFDQKGGIVVSRRNFDIKDETTTGFNCGHDEWTKAFLFTQSQIVSGDVAFVAQEEGKHSLILAANDGKYSTTNITFVITVNPANISSLSLKSLSVFPGFPQKLELAKKISIGLDEKHRICTASLFVNYRIVNMSRGSQIMFKKRSGGELSRYENIEGGFTLLDIINGDIFYQSNNLLNDSVEFLIEEFLVETSIAFWPGSNSHRDIKSIISTDVVVSLYNVNKNNAGNLLSLKELSLQEGGRAALTRQNVNNKVLLNELKRQGSSLISFYKITKTPKHGWMYLDKKGVVSGSVFYQSDVDEERLEYTHDDSESKEDYVGLEILYSYKNGTIKEAVDTLFEKEFGLNILVSQKDDEPFQFVIRNPTVELVQGTYKKITRNHLLTYDPDTSPSKIVYHLINQPSNCKFLLLNKPDDYMTFQTDFIRISHDNLTLSNDDEEYFRYGITEFTQSDIDDELVIILHDSKNHNHDAFYFGVSDGVHPQMFKIFHIKIEPLTTKLKKTSSSLEILQGNIRAVFTTKQIDVETNGNRKFILYKVAREPDYGLIYRNTTPADWFTQQDLDKGLISYVQTDFSTSEDSVLISSPNIFRVSIKIAISVSPIQSTNFSAPTLKPGQEFIFTTKWLDAGKLAIQTDSDPIFEVIKLPNKGELRFKNKASKRESFKSLKNFNRRESIASVDCTKSACNSSRRSVKQLSHDQEIFFTFHQSDVINERISYVASYSQPTNNPEREDSFQYLLSAPRTQKILGHFKMHVSDNLNHLNQTNSEFLEPGNDKTLEETEANQTNDSSDAISFGDKMKVIGSIALVIIIFLGAFIAYKCLKQRKKSKYLSESMFNEQKSSGRLIPKSDPPISLPVVSVDNQEIQEANDSNPLEANPSVAHKCDSAKSEEPQNEDAPSSSSSLPATKNVKHVKNNHPFDWKKVDPELLQHCRKTTPVLHANQYWV